MGNQVFRVEVFRGGRLRLNHYLRLIPPRITNHHYEEKQGGNGSWNSNNTKDSFGCQYMLVIFEPEANNHDDGKHSQQKKPNADVKRRDRAVGHSGEKVR